MANFKFSEFRHFLAKNPLGLKRPAKKLTCIFLYELMATCWHKNFQQNFQNNCPEIPGNKNCLIYGKFSIFRFLSFPRVAKLARNGQQKNYFGFLDKLYPIHLDFHQSNYQYLANKTYSKLA